MAATIRMEVKDETKPGLKSVSNGFDAASKDADKLGKAIERAMDKASTKSKMGFDSIIKAGLGIFGVKQAFDATIQTVNHLADAGSESMKELQGSFVAVEQAAVKFTQDEQVAGFFNALAKQVTVASTALADAPQRWRGVQDAVSRTGLQYAEFFKLVQSGTVETLAEMNRFRDKQMEIEAQTRKMVEAQNFVNGLSTVEEKKRATIREEMAFKAIADEQKLHALAVEEMKRIKDLIAAGKASDEDKKQSAERVAKIFDRLRETKIENDEKAAAADKEFFGKQAKAAEEAATKQLEIEQKRVEAEQQMEAELLAWRREQRHKEIDEEQAAAAEQVRIAAEAKRQKAAILADQMKPLIEKMAGELNPRDVAKQVGQQRAQDAGRQFADKHRDQYQRAEKRGDSETMERLQRRQQQAMQEADRRGQIDVRTGRAGQGEIIQAQKSMVDGVIKKGTADGRFDKAAADALTTAADALAKQAQEKAALEERVSRAEDTIRRVLVGRQGNATRRAQGSGRP